MKKEIENKRRRAIELLNKTKWSHDLKNECCSIIGLCFSDVYKKDIRHFLEHGYSSYEIGEEKIIELHTLFSNTTKMET
jgi:hypothetical protein